MFKDLKYSWACVDTVIASFCYMSMAMIYSVLKTRLEWPVQVGAVAVVFLCHLFLYLGFKLHKIIWRYANTQDFIRLFASITISFFLSTTINVLLFKKWSFIIGYISYMLTLFGIFSIKLIRIWTHRRRTFNSSDDNRQNTMIIGGGSAAKYMLTEMNKVNSRYKPVCILDDDPLKIGRSLEGVPIRDNTSKIQEICKAEHIRVIFFAIPSCDPKNKNRILQECFNTNCSVKILPSINQLNERGTLLAQMKNIEINDILGREPVNLNNASVRAFLKDKVCLVTGGGGSIGSELCRQIMRYQPKKLIIVDINENNCFAIQQEILFDNPNAALSVEIASVREVNRMEQLFIKYKPQLVIHAAAHKHVTYMERNPEEAVKNNVLGTYNTAMLSDKYEVEKFILISTDKAVNTTNFMGASKRCCEFVIQYFAQKSSKTTYSAVRFGNVLGSAGSVVPLFEKQIQKGGPVTITHKDIIRFFMTIPEAASLILQASTFAKSGEIYILDMGEPVKILSLAEKMIRLYGLRPYEDIDIRCIGLRAGEKMYEELFYDKGKIQLSPNEKIFIETQQPIDSDKFVLMLKTLFGAAENNDRDRVKHLLDKLIHADLHATEDTAYDDIVNI